MQIPFLVYGCFALTVLIFELRRIRARRRATGAAATARLFPSAYPTVCSLWVCVLAWGTALDNARIFIGGFDPAFSDSYVMKVVTYLCFFVHDVLLPPAKIPQRRWRRTTKRWVMRWRQLLRKWPNRLQAGV